MIDRRQFIIGGACLVSATAAEALRPRQRMSLLGSAKLEEITPRRFGGWSNVQVGALVQPREEGTLSARLYSQILGRVYENKASGEMVMLALAYGDTQSDLLQLHRPETCYPAFGFTLSNFRHTSVDFPAAASIPTRSMVATAADRVENVTYWTRIGQYLPTSQSEQRKDKFRIALAGFVPDGMLVRCSSLGDDMRANLRSNRRFLHDLVLALAPEHRAAFIGSALSNRLSGAALS